MQCTYSGQVTVVVPAVMVRTGRYADSMHCSSMWSGSYRLRGNLCSLFKVPTPLRWKFLRFPNVTQCTVQLTTYICWLLNAHAYTVGEKLQLLWSSKIFCRFYLFFMNCFFTAITCLLHQWWTCLFGHTNTHKPAIHIWRKGGQLTKPC